MTDNQRDNAPLFVRAEPTLSPRMLVTRRSAHDQVPFPFADPRIEYLYFARNGVYEIGRQLIPEGGEIAMPAYYHGVEVEALQHAGVRLAYYPVHAGMRVDIADIEASLTPRTAAIYLIHYAGFPGPMQEVRALCDERGLLMIEDCALALLSKDGEIPLGSVGDASVFSLYKSLPVPNGGAVVTKATTSASSMAGTIPVPGSARSLATISMLHHLQIHGGRIGSLAATTARTVLRRGSRVAGHQYVGIGTQNFDPDESDLAITGLTTRILMAQPFDQIVARRRANYARLAELFGETAPSVTGPLTPGVCPLIYPIAVANKVEVVRALRQRGIEAINFWSAQPDSPVPAEFPEVKMLRESVVEIPCHQDMGGATLDRMARVVTEVLADQPNAPQART